LRNSNNYGERKEEILDISQELFFKNGYSKTTIDDILNAADVSKGTFYYYFTSKADVLDEIIDRHVCQALEEARRYQKMSGISCTEKIIRIVLSQRIFSNGDQKKLNVITENALLNQKLRERLVIELSPIIAEVIEEGNAEGCFHAEYPIEYTQILISAASVLTDFNPNIISKEKKNKILIALFTMVESALKVEKGDFLPLLNKLLEEN
jgi:AcrR family transcriptional regulator